MDLLIRKPAFLNDLVVFFVMFPPYVFVVLDSFIWIKTAQSKHKHSVFDRVCDMHCFSRGALCICPGPVSTVNEIVPSHNFKKVYIGSLIICTIYMLCIGNNLWKYILNALQP